MVSGDPGHDDPRAGLEAPCPCGSGVRYQQCRYSRWYADVRAEVASYPQFAGRAQHAVAGHRAMIDGVMRDLRDLPWDGLARLGPGTLWEQTLTPFGHAIDAVLNEFEYVARPRPYRKGEHRRPASRLET